MVASAHEWMEWLIEDLLTFARIGEAAIELERIDLADLIVTCWEPIRTEAATLEIDVDGAIQGDPDRVRQLVENLLQNAIEHGGADATITVARLESGSGFFVADDGPGIPEADRNLVLESGYSMKETGSGFGLAIVKESADAYGWSIRVTDSADGGARFEIADVETVERTD